MQCKRLTFREVGVVSLAYNEPPGSMKQLIEQVRTKLDGMSVPENLADMFERCYLNAFRTTMRRKRDGTTFIITGDIPAMWLRDSAAQVRPYLIPARHDEVVADWILGVIRRQIDYIHLDPYANAFNETPDGAGHQEDLTDMNPWIWERKYEIDSLCYPIQLSYLFWKNTGITSHFDESFLSAVQRILDVWEIEQDHEHRSRYRFQRMNCPPSDTLPREGLGNPVAVTGMTWSGFRPSDDACKYGYLIPSNMFAVVVLEYLIEIAEQLRGLNELAERARRLKSEIDEGIRRYGITDHPDLGKIYAYETDGLGHHCLMDDANVPSLLSIPYIGYAHADDDIYRNTRKFVLSRENPYYYNGQAAAGIGSPHTPTHHIWPIAIAMQGLTASDRDEQLHHLRTLCETDAGTGFMHESFHKDDPSQFTRPWFSWANALFCELVLAYCGMPVHPSAQRFG